ncbi:hypothetical protein J6S37_02995 [Candidatus Saccharibacteria bacterium]|nr:hypothetical protein [Candidatus Saccharibacteria bacterium]
MGKNYFISSISVEEKLGSARITIEGNIPVPNGCDDPLVELFRPVRLKYFDSNNPDSEKKDDGIFFTILTNHKENSVVCTLIPSNRRGRTIQVFLSIANKALKGGDGRSGIIADYQMIIEKFFCDSEGLSLYLDATERIEKASEEMKADLCNACDEITKRFVKKNGLKMPSRKKKARKKTKAEKRESGKAYLKAHPEILNKKPAN